MRLPLGASFSARIVPSMLATFFWRSVRLRVLLGAAPPDNGDRSGFAGIFLVTCLSGLEVELEDRVTRHFCTLPKPRILRASDLGVVVRDAFPISPGHTLIIPKRHIGSFFDGC